MKDTEKIHEKKSLDDTIADCKLQDNLYKSMDTILDEMDEHLINGRYKEYEKLLNKLRNLNDEVTATEYRIKIRVKR